MEQKQVIQFGKDIKKFKKSLFKEIKKMIKARSTHKMQSIGICSKTIVEISKNEKPLDNYRIETLLSLYSKLSEIPAGIKLSQSTRSKYR